MWAPVRQGPQCTELSPTQIVCHNGASGLSEAPPFLSLKGGREAAFPAIAGQLENVPHALLGKSCRGAELGRKSQQTRIINSRNRENSRKQEEKKIKIGDGVRGRDGKQNQNKEREKE